MERAVALAAGRAGPHGGILVLLDADDDCPAELASDLLRFAEHSRPDRSIRVVLAKAEYESWFLAAASSLAGHRGIDEAASPPPDSEAIRDAKGWLSARMPPGRRYRETLHQAALTARFDLDSARAAPSFDKMWREAHGRRSELVVSSITAWEIASPGRRSPRGRCASSRGRRPLLCASRPHQGTCGRLADARDLRRPHDLAAVPRALLLRGGRGAKRDRRKQSGGLDWHACPEARIWNVHVEPALPASGAGNSGRGNHRTSIFRLMVGVALARRVAKPLPASWESADM